MKKKTRYIVGGLMLALGLSLVAEQVISARNLDLQFEKERQEKAAIKALAVTYLQLDTYLEPNIDRGGLFKKAKIDGYSISGSIRNDSPDVTYKDVTIRLGYFSKTNTRLGTFEFVVYETFEPGQSRDFNYLIEVPAETKQHSSEILNAIPVSMTTNYR